MNAVFTRKRLPVGGRMTFRAMLFVALTLGISCEPLAAQETGIYLDDYAGDNSRARFVMEVEHYIARNEDVKGAWWRVDGDSLEFVEGPSADSQAPNAVPGARGDYMEVLGEVAPLAPVDPSYQGGTMDLKLAIETPGTYRLYARWRGRDSGSDSFYAHLLTPENTLLVDAGPLWFVFHQFHSSWIWDHRGVRDSTAVAGAGFPDEAIWVIPESGVYTLRISQREGVTALDALVFQTVNLPSPSGLGPPESAVQEAPEQLSVDIRPGACPNLLNLKSRGHLEVAVLGTAHIDASEIDPDSARLGGAKPFRARLADIGSPANGSIECSCPTRRKDGHVDLILTFDSAEVAQGLINDLGSLAHRQAVAVQLEVAFWDGTPAAGADCVVAVGTRNASCPLP